MSVVWVDDTGTEILLPDPPAVVLLHFAVPYRHAGHVAWQVGTHGRAWRLIVAAARAGTVTIARVWPCADGAAARDRLETVEKAGSRARYCPVCRSKATQE